MTAMDDAVAAAARRHGFSDAAVRALWDALVKGGGRQAQFSHPELGGMGQWSGGMAQIGDMFNAALKARVAAVCADLAAAARPEAMPSPSDGDWWPAGLGRPASAGSQNATRYAMFPDSRRLAVLQNGVVTLYDTGEHRISGFSQQQAGSSAMEFTGQHGPIALDGLRVADPDGTAPAPLALLGGCFCGAVRYEARGTPFHETLCHCADCRRIAGAPAVAWFSIRRRDFIVTAGAPKRFRSSERAVRRFCASCGTPLTYEADAFPDEVDVTTVSLDDPAVLPPRDHSQAGERLTWDVLDDGLPQRR